jgi:hypothetical protein
MSELDGLRIRRAIALRRSLYRGRSYAVIAAVACAGVAAQCGWLACGHARVGGWTLRPVLLIVLMTCAFAGSFILARRAVALSREARESTVPEPEAPPDFSTLSDGSQRVRNLEDVR